PKKLTATAKDTCETCSVKVDKQIKCGAGPFVDVGFVTNNEDGTASCLGWNAFTLNGTGTAAETLTVQYVAQNTGGTALFGCTVTDSNTAISSTAVSIGDVAQGGTSSPVPVNKTCSDTLDAREPERDEQRGGGEPEHDREPGGGGDGAVRDRDHRGADAELLQHDRGDV